MEDKHNNGMLQSLLLGGGSSGGGGSGLPPVTPADNGKLLGVDDGEWEAVDALAPFIVTLTPTAQDFSGTMSATVGEIAQEFQKGRRIVFRLLMSASESYDAECTARYNTSNTYPSFNAFIVTTGQPVGNAICFLGTITTDDPTKNTYSTVIFPIVTTTWQGGSY